MSGAAARSSWHRFGEKVRLAVETSRERQFESGTCGLEVELNVLDGDLRPVLWVGYGHERRSFADYLHDERLPGWARDRFQLEVFHWMTEAATRPYYSAAAAVAEARVLEAVLHNVLADLELDTGGRFLALHGSIPHPAEVGPGAIPAGWNLAHRRYLDRCVALYGAALATAGIHTNHSFPEALLSWDFMHLPPGRRRGSTMEDLRNQAVIRATRLLRPHCALFAAVSAASPIGWEEVDGEPAAVLTDIESQRLLTFPNPASLDVPGLYASHAEYLRISYDLVRRGIRFGGNNWTPVRARSDVDPVNRNILATSRDLAELYQRGIYAAGAIGSLEEAERALLVEHLCARVDLPMNRVEVRTDEAGDSFELALAKVVLKQLLMLRFYADPEVGASYAYDELDVARARRNEAAVAVRGLDAEVEHPFTEERVGVRAWLGAVLDDLAPLADALGAAAELEPLRAMAGGGPSPATELRRDLQGRLAGGRRAPSGALVVEPEALFEWAAERRRRLEAEIRRIDADPSLLGPERPKLEPLLAGLRRQGGEHAALPVRLERAPVVRGMDGDPAAEVVQLAAELVRIPSVTNCPDERLDEVRRCARFVAGHLRHAGLEVRLYDEHRYPALVAGLPGALLAPVTLAGHFDVVAPEPDDGQFEPRVEGDWLWGRGAADMKTVVASWLVWLAQVRRAGPPYPPVNLLLVGNEENGEGEPTGTPHVLEALAEEAGWEPALMVVGERTGERGHERVGDVCTANRGVLRFTVRARGRRQHTGTGGTPAPLLDRLLEARSALTSLFGSRLTLSSFDGWESSARFPFVSVGEPGVYNITADSGVLGVEVRPIPEDDHRELLAAVDGLCRELGLDLEVEVAEGGIRCPADEPHLARLLEAVSEVAGAPAVVGRKLAGTSARFAPGGRAVVWGQTGLGPHARDERHFIPSIVPHLEILDRFARRLRETAVPGGAAAG